MRDTTLSSLIWVRISRFTSHSNQLSNEFLNRFELTIAQFDVLMQVRIHQPLNQTELAEKVTVTQGGISRMLARLEKEGYIVRKQDWKTKSIRLTPKAEAILERAFPEQSAFQSSFFDEVLSEEEQKTLYALMTRVHKHSLRKELPPE
ncbi:MarR family winged helix-turn-helix transcriptional regulator [Paenibacillus glycinis]|uniref:MarR family transcriptional regulator n=1 Tax=Paenibacillus glycinis TaxID=2697035 RepID=A0ABW9XR94_9BACL|nr:MarR family transcriptional regulator [Paenibacillus glycinis]NBD25170.1 MarR family transcriptional regulator [Paenibacillus glycinis]